VNLITKSAVKVINSYCEGSFRWFFCLILTVYKLYRTNLLWDTEYLKIRRAFIKRRLQKLSEPYGALKKNIKSDIDYYF